MTAPQPVIAHIDRAQVQVRGGGVESVRLIAREGCPSARVMTGFTRMPPGGRIPFHSHNCDEQALVIEGAARVEIAGRDPVLIGRHDISYIPAGVSHRLVNVGEEPLTLLWIYDAPVVTRTFTETGETVPHLSATDLVDGS